VRALVVLQLPDNDGACAMITFESDLSGYRRRRCVTCAALVSDYRITTVRVLALLLLAMVLCPGTTSMVLQLCTVTVWSCCCTAHGVTAVWSDYM
jgi:hypothetical protein